MSTSNGRTFDMSPNLVNTLIREDPAFQKAPLVKIKENYAGMLIIDSKYRQPGDKLNNFLLNKGNWQFTNHQVTAIAAWHVYFPINIPNVNSFNNRLTFIDSIGNTYTELMAPGYYNSTNFLTQFLVLLNTATSIQNGLTFGANNGGAVFIGTISGPVEGKRYLISSSNLTTFAFVHSPNYIQDLTDLSGFNQPKDMVLQQAFDNKARGNLIYTRYIDVVCNEVFESQQLKDEDSKTTVTNILARIYIDRGPQWVGTEGVSGDNALLYEPGVHCAPFTVNYEYKNLRFIKYISTRSVGVLNVQLRDEFGYPLRIDEDNGFGNNNFVIQCQTRSFLLE